LISSHSMKWSGVSPIILIVSLSQKGTRRWGSLTHKGLVVISIFGLKYRDQWDLYDMVQITTNVHLFSTSIVIPASPLCSSADICRGLFNWFSWVVCWVWVPLCSLCAGSTWVLCAFPSVASKDLVIMAFKSNGSDQLFWERILHFSSQKCQICRSKMPNQE